MPNELTPARRGEDPGPVRYLSARRNGLLEVAAAVRALEVHERRQLAALEYADSLDQASDACSRVEMPEIGLDGPQSAESDIRRTSTENLREGAISIGSPSGVPVLRAGCSRCSRIDFGEASAPSL